jgi:hypothetical protein
MSIRALLCSIFGALLLDACMPADMHVNRGLDPKLADDDVRFRTTYYFRTFDYCWDFNAKMRQSSTGEDFSYRSIIPKTDTLYRYRMTGKASSTFSRIRFESGVLKAAVLDPFGTQVSFSEAADGFIVRGASEVKEAAERSAEQDRLRAGKLEQLKSLTGYYLGLDPNSASEVRTAALEALKKALEDYRGASPAPSSLEGKQLQDAIGAVEAKTTTLFAADKELSECADSIRRRCCTESVGGPGKPSQGCRPSRSRRPLRHGQITSGAGYGRPERRGASYPNARAAHGT